ncbi:MAG: tetratricopeptide repeat protein [Verrucomicrobiaceae bacterium]|nr:tetratricopeptide repeat protein [Verrucomicrobiaceae bacterium]
MSTEPSNNPAALDTPADEQALEKQFKKLLLAGLVIIAALVAWGLIRSNQQAAADAASEAFSSAKTAEDCDLVIKNHSGTVAAANALLLKADLHWEKNEKTSAVDALKKFISENATHPAYAQTVLALATKQEAMGDKADAKAGFERVLSEFAGTDLAQLAQIRLGDMLWADGKADEAKKAYEDATSKYPGVSTFEETSKTRLDWLAANLPTKEVDPPPAPKSTEPAKPEFKIPSVTGGGSLPGLPEMKLSSDIAPPGSPPPAPKSATSLPVEVPAPAPTPAPAPAAPKQ